MVASFKEQLMVQSKVAIPLLYELLSLISLHPIQFLNHNYLLQHFMFQSWRMQYPPSLQHFSIVKQSQMMQLILDPLRQFLLHLQLRAYLTSQESELFDVFCQLIALGLL